MLHHLKKPKQMSLNSSNIFRNAKKSHRFVTVDPLPSLSDRHSNLREEQLDQAWEILPQDFPMEMAIKRMAILIFVTQIWW